jgi:hypothetical protein
MPFSRAHFYPAVLLTCAIHPVLAWQDAPRDRPPDVGDEVVVKGCLDGPTLLSTETTTTDDTGRVSRPLTYQLRAKKDLLKQLRDEYDGHVVELTGILKSSLRENSIRSKKIGRTRITIGAGTPSRQASGPDSGEPLPILEVRSYEGTPTSCKR